MEEFSLEKRCSICFEDNGQIVSLHGEYEHWIHLDCFSFSLSVRDLYYTDAKCPECLGAISYDLHSLLNDPGFRFAALCRFGSLDMVRIFLNNYKLPQCTLNAGYASATAGQNMDVLNFLLKQFGSNYILQLACVNASIKSNDYGILNIWLKHSELKETSTHFLGFSPDLNLETFEYYLNFSGYCPFREHRLLRNLMSYSSSENVIAYLNQRDYLIDKYVQGVFKRRKFKKNVELLIKLTIINRRPDILSFWLVLKSVSKSVCEASIILAHTLGYSEIVEIFVKKGVRIPHSNPLFDISEAVKNGNINETRRLAIKYGPKYSDFALTIAIEKRNINIIDCLNSLDQDFSSNLDSIFRLDFKKDLDFLLKLCKRNIQLYHEVFYDGIFSGKDIADSFITSYEQTILADPEEFKVFKGFIRLFFLVNIAERQYKSLNIT